MHHVDHLGPLPHPLHRHTGKKSGQGGVRGNEGIALRPDLPAQHPGGGPISGRRHLFLQGQVDHLIRLWNGCRCSAAGHMDHPPLLPETAQVGAVKMQNMGICRGRKEYLLAHMRSPSFHTAYHTLPSPVYWKRTSFSTGNGKKQPMMIKKSGIQQALSLLYP